LNNYKTQKIPKGDYDFRRRNIFEKIIFIFTKTWQWLNPLLRQIYPRDQFRKGAAIGMLALILVISVTFGLSIKPGFWDFMNAPIGILMVFIALLILSAIIGLVFRIIYEVPKFLNWPGLFVWWGLVIFLVFLDFPFLVAIVIGLAAVFLVGVFGGTIAVLSGDDFKYFDWFKKVWFLILIPLIGLIGFFIVSWLSGEGSDKYLTGVLSTAKPNSQTILPDPALVGPYPVIKLSYGSGSVQQRSEFGQDVQMRTESVDASKFLKGNSPWKLRLRKWYWGFDTDNFPLNGMVWFPQSQGQFPLVIIIHGNRKMESPSHRGYQYLSQLLASRGFIVACIDVNFLNSSWSGRLKHDVMTRSWIILKHLSLWREWNQSETNRFHGIVDMDNISLIGHGSGGESALIACILNRLKRYPEEAFIRFDFNFNIRSIVAITPTTTCDFPFKKQVSLPELNYLLIQGSHDVRTRDQFAGNIYNRIPLGSGNYHFKASVVSYRSNHSRFNTIWNGYDYSFPLSLIYNRKPLLSPEDHQKICMVFVSAFLDVIRKADLRYQNLFRDIQSNLKWLPQDFYLTRFLDSSFRKICNFEEDIDITSGTLIGTQILANHLVLWREGNIGAENLAFKQNQVVYLGWKNENNERKIPSYSILLPEKISQLFEIDPDSRLTFSLADARSSKLQGSVKNDPIDLSIEIATGDKKIKHSLSSVRQVPVPIKPRYTKFKQDHLFHRGGPKPQLQTFEIPMSVFLRQSPEFKLEEIKSIRLIFDKTKTGEIIMDNLGFIKPAPLPQKNNKNS